MRAQKGRVIQPGHHHRIARHRRTPPARCDRRPEQPITSSSPAHRIQHHPTDTRIATGDRMRGEPPGKRLADLPARPRPSLHKLPQRRRTRPEQGEHGRSRTRPPRRRRRPTRVTPRAQHRRPPRTQTRLRGQIHETCQERLRGTELICRHETCRPEVTRVEAPTARCQEQHSVGRPTATAGNRRPATYHNNITVHHNQPTAADMAARSNDRGCGKGEEVAPQRVPWHTSTPGDEPHTFTHTIHK